MRNKMFHYPCQIMIRYKNWIKCIPLTVQSKMIRNLVVSLLESLFVRRFMMASSSVHIHFTDGAEVSLSRCTALHGGWEKFQVGAKNLSWIIKFRANKSGYLSTILMKWHSISSWNILDSEGSNFFSRSKRK